VAIYLARRLSGQALATIGVAFGLENYSSVSSVACRMEQRIGKDRSLRRKVEAIERRIL
jgi:chromosomal replication initiation ATPase DnaA